MKLLTKFSLIFLLTITSYSFAYIIYEFSLYGGAGVGTLLSDKKVGNESIGFGEHFGLGYTFFFSENWGIGSGVEIALYNMNRKIKSRKDSTQIEKDEENNNYVLRSLQKNIEEEINATILQIPFMLNFNTSGDNQFYAAVGGKIGIPLSITQKSFIGSMNNSRFYSEEGVEYTANTHRFLNDIFDTLNVKKEEDLSSKIAFFASAETGMKWKLSDFWRLYTGVYFDYDLTGIAEGYNAMATGVKIKLSFGGDPVIEEIRRKAAAKKADSLAAVKIMEEAPAAMKIAEERFLAIKAAEDENRRKEAEIEAARLAAIKAAEEREKRLAATQLQAEIDAIQYQILNDFQIQQTEPNEEQKQHLDRIVGLLQKYPQLDFRINGHTCDLGDEVTNYRMGMDRAKSVQKYVLEKGIDRGRILGVGSKLHYEPLVPNTSEENRKKNRRVEILIENSDRKVTVPSTEAEEKTEDKTDECICNENNET